MTFESEGLYIVAFLHMVAAGELCCLSDNSGLDIELFTNRVSREYKSPRIGTW